MVTQKPQSNRVLLIVLVVLYVLTLAAFNYANWAADPEFMQWWMPLVNSVLLSIPLCADWKWVKQESLLFRCSMVTNPSDNVRQRSASAPPDMVAALDGLLVQSNKRRWMARAAASARVEAPIFSRISLM